MEYVVATDHGEWFAISDDVDTTHEVGKIVNVQFSERGPVLLPH